MNDILKNIEKDEVGIAYKKAVIESSKNNLSGFVAYATIISLNKLVSTALKSKSNCKSSWEDIYKLADLCCQADGMWKQERTACMQCIYHIARYLLSQSMPVHAKQLCGYFFNLRNKDGDIEWAEKETLVLSNTVAHFVYFLNDANKEILGETPISWFNFVLALNELNNFSSTSDLFRMCISLLRKSHNSKAQWTETTSSLLKVFCTHLESLAKNKPKWAPKDDLSAVSINILTDIISFINANEIIDPLSFHLFNYIKCLKNVAQVYSIKDLSSVDLEIVKVTLHMCVSVDSETSLLYFDDFLNMVQTKDSMSSDICSFIHTCLSVFRAKISNILHKDKERIKRAFPILHSLYLKSKPKTAITSKSKCCEMLHAFTSALFILNNCKIESDVLQHVYKVARLYFKEFSLLVGAAQNNKTVFEFGVNYCITTIQAYKDMELYRETANLSRDLLKYILPLSQEYIPRTSFVVKLERLLTSFIQSYMKMNLSVEAQTALIGFAGVHPQYVDVVFKYWAELKASSTDYNFQKDATAYDVITTHKDVLEEKWAPCLVKSINIDKFLLEEVKAYSKHRILNIEAVIAVYKVAVKVVKDKIMLAEILVAAVDSVSADGYIGALKNLHISIGNINGSLLKMKSQTNDEKKLCQINCIIANLLYQQVRCNIVEIRKKAEDEVEMMYIPAKQGGGGIPVLGGDGCNVAPAYSCLKVKEQSAISEKMFECVKYWSEAVNYASPEDSSVFSFRYLKGLAYLLRLYCYKAKEVEMWKLIYNLADKLGEEKYKVLAVAELLSLLVTVNPSWIKNAEQSLKSEKVTKKSYAYSLFYINLGRNLYFNKKFDEASKIASELDEGTLKRHFLVFAQYKMLIFLLKKDKLELSPNRPEATLYLLIKVFENVLYLVKNNSWKTFSEKCVLQWILLEFSFTISKTYFDLRAIRHAVCYAKKQLMAAQRLALPIRVCQFLAVLCNADLQTGHMLEANEKLSGLDTVLELDHINVRDNEDDLENYLICLTSTVNDISRPKFLSHEFNCSCIECTTIEFLTVILDAFALKGVYTSAGKEHSLAQHVFTIGEEIIEVMNSKEQELCCDLLYCFVETKVRFYLSLSFAYAARGEIDGALIYNSTAEKLLEPVKEYNRLLKQEILCQFTTLQFCFFYEPPPPKSYKAKIYTSDMLLQENVKTPEPVSSIKKISRCLKSAVSTTKYKLPVSPMAIKPRKIIFDADKELEGKYEYDCKENVSSPDCKTSLKVELDKSPLAKVLPGSPKLALRKKLFYEESGSQTPQALSDWVLETPKPAEKSYSALTHKRKAQTERKVKKNLQSELFATPFMKKSIPEIKVFCDDEDNSEKLTKTVKANTRRKGTTVKKSTVKKEKKTVKPVSGRKLSFDSDTEEETKTRKPVKRLSSEKLDEVIPKQIGRCLFDGNEDGETSKKDSNERPSLQSDESGIIEPSFIDHRPLENVLCLPLTPLEESMKQLSLSGKKLRSLSTKKMTRLQNLQETPSSSTPLRRTSSRLNTKKSEV